MKSVFQAGPEYVMSVITDEVEFMFGDYDGQGIGSSDINACARAIVHTIGMDHRDVPEVELDMIRTAIHNVLCDLEDAA